MKKKLKDQIREGWRIVLLEEENERYKALVQKQKMEIMRLKKHPRK